MSMFQGATHVAITGGTHIAAGAGSSVTIHQGGPGGPSVGLQVLSAAAAHTALHDSSARFDAPRCHRNTRTTHLDAFERWMLGLGGEYDSKRLIWLNGGAGAGKSAIMQSIIERCAQHAVVLGSFFFSRADPSRNYAEVLIPTLAYQLARDFPGAMPVLEPIIQRDPLIFKASLRTQAYELLVRPLLHLVETGVINSTSPHRRVFVIDGLDECDDRDKQAHVIHVVASILCDYGVPVSFVIASRPETAISRAFQMENRVHSVFSSVTLDDNVEASSDIRQFIEDSFLDIRDTHPQRKHIPSNWPDSDSVNALVSKSSGHFVYAATAMKFISSSDEHPTRALQVVQGLVSSRIGNPFAELDALYLHILTSAKYSSQVLAILRHCVLTYLDNSVKAVCFMYPHFSPEDVDLFLSDVHALVTLSPNKEAEMRISLKHASLCDFLKDENRSHRIYMDAGDYLTSLLPCYFRVFDINSQPPFLEPYSISCFAVEFTAAITLSQDIELLQSLIRMCSPQCIWNLYQGSSRENDLMPSYSRSRGHALFAVSSYLHTIRDSAANHDNALYIHHFEHFVQILMADVSKLIEMKPHHRIIPALIFSSSPSCLTSVAPHLISVFPLHIESDLIWFFRYMQPKGVDVEGIMDPRSYEAIRSLPESRISWGSDLAYALQHVLQELLGYTWIPLCLCPNLHERWLNRMKSFKHVSLGSPQLPSAFYSYVRTLPTPKLYRLPYEESSAFRHHGFCAEDAQEISEKRERCFVYLQTIIHYLHKCDCTSELAKLARRSLPKAALWFPKLMKKARRKMDAYVRRWEESLDGLFEKTRSLSINDMD